LVGCDALLGCVNLRLMSRNLCIGRLLIGLVGLHVLGLLLSGGVQTGLDHFS